MLVSVYQELHLVIRTWLRFAPPVVVCQTLASYDTFRTLFSRKCRRPQHRSQSLILFHLHRMGFDIHYWYGRLNELFLNGLVHLAPLGVRYSPWFGLVFFARAWEVLLEPLFHTAQVICCNPMPGLRGSCQILLAAFPIRIQ